MMRVLWRLAGATIAARFEGAAAAAFDAGYLTADSWVTLCRVGSPAKRAALHPLQSSMLPLQHPLAASKGCGFIGDGAALHEGWSFTTPKLLEAMAERVDLIKAGIKGVFCGGTTMDQQYTRFLVEEICENQIGFVPTYGNTLMGLARHRPFGPENDYSITYHAPQPRAVLRVVDPKQTENLVDYDAWGRVELTTLTKEFFMPRFLERDEAIRRSPWEECPWDGVAEVRPFGAMEKKIVEGVY